MLREVGAVTLKVGEGFAWTRSAELTDPSYDVVGAVGQKVYVVPESQVTPNQLWPGFSTEGVDYSGFPEGLDYEMTLLEGPAGGRVVFGAQTLLGAGFTTYLAMTWRSTLDAWTVLLSVEQLKPSILP